MCLELGFVVPVIRIRDNIQLKPNEYMIKIKGNMVARGELLLNHYLAMSPGIDDDSIQVLKRPNLPLDYLQFGLMKR